MSEVKLSRCMFRRILITIFLCSLDTGDLDARSTIPREYGFAVASAIGV